MKEYDAFFSNMKAFLQQAELHKRRGNNDFNPYLEMWSEKSEVKLHSSLICGFLDPQNNHYQGDVFLESFLVSIEDSEYGNLKEWFGQTSNARVCKEYRNIDIYITNGEKHIILENKIGAKDQDKQIERYIEIIVEEQSSNNKDSKKARGSSQNESESSKEQQSIAYENITVLYLAPQKRTPSEQSLGEWEISGGHLAKQEHKVKFQAISYNDEILRWIESARDKVDCITNLNAALLFYKDAVLTLTNKKENTMSVEKFLMQNNTEENMQIVFEILGRKEAILKQYFDAIGRKIESEYEDYRVESGADFIDVWHKDYYDERLFSVYASCYDDTKIEFGASLGVRDTKQASGLFEKLQEVLDVGDDAFLDVEDIRNPKKKTKYIFLQQEEEMSLADFTQEKFMSFFEGAKNKADELNKKIKEDLEKEDSQLRKFLCDNQKQQN